MPDNQNAAITLMLSAALVLGGCNKSAAPSPVPTSTPSVSNISGDYTGTTQDAQGGAGTANATLAQNGTSAGGAITIKQSAVTVTAQVSLSITTSNALSGAMVIDYPNGTTCTFSTSGAYNATTNVLSGSYTAVTNCAGDTGTYSLTQQCTDTVTSADRTVMTTPKC